MPTRKKFLARGPGKNLAIVEPKYTFLSWEAKPQFFIKGPIKKRKGGFFPYSICLAGLLGSSAGQAVISRSPECLFCYIRLPFNDLHRRCLLFV